MLSNLKKDLTKVSKKEEQQYIVFLVGEEQFGVDIKQAREIIPESELTHIPSAPDFVKGVINLRGEIIPIIDLKTRIGLKNDKQIVDQKIIVVEVNGSLIGMQVDDVLEMIRLYNDDITAPPKIVRGINSDYLSGVGKVKDKLLIILNLKKILSDQEIQELDKMGME